MRTVQRGAQPNTVISHLVPPMEREPPKDLSGCGNVLPLMFLLQRLSPAKSEHHEQSNHNRGNRAPSDARPS